MGPCNTAGPDGWGREILLDLTDGAVQHWMDLTDGAVQHWMNLTDGAVQHSMDLADGAVHHWMDLTDGARHGSSKELSVLIVFTANRAAAAKCSGLTLLTNNKWASFVCPMASN